jgi:hypothetical protein
MKMLYIHLLPVNVWPGIINAHKLDHFRSEWSDNTDVVFLFIFESLCCTIRRTLIFSKIFFKWRETRMPLASASLFCQAIEVVWKAENPQLERLAVCGISMQWQ